MALGIQNKKELPGVERTFTLFSNRESDKNVPFTKISVTAIKRMNLGEAEAGRENRK